MTKTLRFTRCLIIWLLITLPLELVGLLVLSVVLLFTSEKAVQLPSVFGHKLFKWWDNHESYFMMQNHPDLDGLSGPTYYRDREGLNLRDYWPRYLARLRWLGIRNPLNYFQYRVIGAIMDTSHVFVTQTPPFEDINRVGGKIEAKTLNGRYYEYYYVIPYKFWNGRAMRVRWGWKISSSWRPLQQFVFVLNPFFKLG